MNLRDTRDRDGRVVTTADERKGYALIGAALVVGLVTVGLGQACGPSKAGFCLLGTKL